MAWFPRAVRREIRPGSNDPAIKVVGAILHVDAGNTRDLYNYFNGPSGGIESHFQIAKDGTVFQYRDTGREADANYKANSFVQDGVRKGFVSIETQGLENGEWTADQMKSIKDLLVWLADVHDFKLQVSPDWNGPGVGYHVMFGAPGAWTPVAKSCPGPKRIKQFRDVLVPWMAGRNKPAPKPEPAAPKFPGEGAFVLGKRNDAVTILGKALKEAGFAKHFAGKSYTPGPTFTEYDRANVRDFQLSRPELRGDADGYPGPLTWKLLMKEAN